MSPFPAHVDRPTLVQTARRIVAQEGLEALSLGRLASALGIKAPSLYHHIQSKTDLLQAMNAVTLGELLAALDASQAAIDPDPVEAVLALARAYRAYALANPVAYHLLLGSSQPDLRPDERDRLALALPIEAQIARITGPGRALAALRGLWALLHGFVMLEMADQFQRPGEVDAAWEEAVRAYLAGWRTGLS